MDRLEWLIGKALEFKRRDQRLDSCQRFLFFRRRRSISIYKSYIGGFKCRVQMSFKCRPRRMIYPYTFERAGATRPGSFFINFNMFTSHVLNGPIITHNTHRLGLIKEKVKGLRLKKKKCWRGANPRPIVLNTSALPYTTLTCCIFIYSVR